MRALLLAVIGLALAAPAAGAKTLHFSGYDFVVRPAQLGGPGPNAWSPRNAWVDKRGRLHLKLGRRNGKWYAAEVHTTQRLGFGRYEFQVEGRIGRLDRNVVIGLFNYPTDDIGPDATNEIDIEFARWGQRKGRIGNYTVWPVDAALDPTTHSFPMPRRIVRSTHRFDWSAASLSFRSQRGLRTDGRGTFAEWTYAPVDAADRIGQDPMPLHINIWAFRGMPPADGEDVEIVIRKFTFIPE